MTGLRNYLRVLPCLWLAAALLLSPACSKRSNLPGGELPQIAASPATSSDLESQLPDRGASPHESDIALYSRAPDDKAFADLYTDETGVHAIPIAQPELGKIGPTGIIVDLAKFKAGATYDDVVIANGELDFDSPIRAVLPDGNGGVYVATNANKFRTSLLNGARGLYHVLSNGNLDADFEVPLGIEVSALNTHHLVAHPDGLHLLAFNPEHRALSSFNRFTGRPSCTWSTANSNLCMVSLPLTLGVETFRHSQLLGIFQGKYLVFHRAATDATRYNAKLFSFDLSTGIFSEIALVGSLPSGATNQFVGGTLAGKHLVLQKYYVNPQEPKNIFVFALTTSSSGLRAEIQDTSAFDTSIGTVREIATLDDRHVYIISQSLTAHILRIQSDGALQLTLLNGTQYPVSKMVHFANVANGKLFWLDISCTAENSLIKSRMISNLLNGNGAATTAFPGNFCPVAGHVLSGVVPLSESTALLYGSGGAWKSPAPAAIPSLSDLILGIDLKFKKVTPRGDGLTIMSGSKVNRQVTQDKIYVFGRFLAKNIFDSYIRVIDRKTHQFTREKYAIAGQPLAQIGGQDLKICGQNVVYRSVINNVWSVSVYDLNTGQLKGAPIPMDNTVSLECDGDRAFATFFPFKDLRGTGTAEPIFEIDLQNTQLTSWRAAPAWTMANVGRYFHIFALSRTHVLLATSATYLNPTRDDIHVLRIDSGEVDAEKTFFVRNLFWKSGTLAPGIVYVETSPSGGFRIVGASGKVADLESDLVLSKLYVDNIPGLNLSRHVVDMVHISNKSVFFSLGRKRSDVITLYKKFKGNSLIRFSRGSLAE